MRVVGYTRELPGPEPGDTVFAQSERIRRWAQSNSHQLVATCQDPRSLEGSSPREGYLTVLRILDGGQADMVVIPSLTALSADKIDQEIMLADLRSRCRAVAVVDADEQEALSDPSPDPGRRFVRDVLDKQDSYDRMLEETRPREVIVRLIPPEPPSGNMQAS